jgi:hypothetical protein
MKKTMILAFVLSLASSAAFAGRAPLLRYEARNLTVSPKYAWSRTCTVYPDVIIDVTKGGMASNTPIEKKVAWTHDVPNAAKVSKLVAAAKKGKITKGPEKDGGRTNSYFGVELLPDGTKDVLLALSGAATKINESDAAKTLVKFLDFNCNQQN